MKKRWRGICVACGIDLYGDPLRHYTSDSHLVNVAHAERRESRQRLGLGTVAAAERLERVE